MLHFAWDSWQTIRRDDKLWKQIRSPDLVADVRQVALICGPVSGNLVPVDFDNCTPTPEFWRASDCRRITHGAIDARRRGGTCVDQGGSAAANCRATRAHRQPSIMPANVERADKPPQVEITLDGALRRSAWVAASRLSLTRPTPGGAAPDAPPTVVTPVTLLMAYWTQCVAPTEETGHRTVTPVTTALMAARNWIDGAAQRDRRTEPGSGGRAQCRAEQGGVCAGAVGGGRRTRRRHGRGGVDRNGAGHWAGRERDDGIDSQRHERGRKRSAPGQPLASLVDAYDGFGPMPGQTVHVNGNGNGNGKVTHAVAAVTEEKRKKAQFDVAVCRA